MAWGVLLQGRGICSLRIQALLRLAILLGSSSVAKHSAVLPDSSDVGR